VEKQAESSARQHRLASELAIDNIVGKMGHMPSDAMQKVATLTVNKFKEDGIDLVRILSARLGRELSIEKTAEHAIFPAGEPYLSIDGAMEEARKYRIEKEACLKKKSRLTKAGQAAEATSLVNTIVSPALEMAKAPLSEYFSREKGLSPADVSLFAPVFQYRLKNFQNTQSFIDVASDPFVKNYRMDTIKDAFNHVIGTMPELGDPRYRQVLTALVRKQLAQENLFDPAELANLARSMKDFTSAEQARETGAAAMQARMEEKVKGSRKPLAETLASAIGGSRPADIASDPVKKAIEEYKVHSKEIRDEAERAAQKALAAQEKNKARKDRPPVEEPAPDSFDQAEPIPGMLSTDMIK
jgi:hypothetical protein